MFLTFEPRYKKHWDVMKKLGLTGTRPRAPKRTAGAVAPGGGKKRAAPTELKVEEGDSEEEDGIDESPSTPAAKKIKMSDEDATGSV
jgi:hypothetical protein